MASLSTLPLRDFASTRAALISHLRTNYPDKWSNLTTANAGMILLDLAAYVGVSFGWNMDRLANEVFPDSARTPEALIRHALARGYVPQGVVPSSILVDASVDSPVTGVDIVIPAGGQLSASDGSTFEVSEQVIIPVGSTTPRVHIADDSDTVPQYSTLDFIAGKSEVVFTSGVAFHTGAISPGCWIRPTSGIYTDWARIVGVSDDSKTLFLESGFNASFNFPFMVRLMNNDTSPSTILLASSPVGNFASTASTSLGSTVVTVAEALPDNIVPGLWFRMNNPSNCQYNDFFLISGISEDRMSFTLNRPYAPLNEGGFDSVSASFEIEHRGVKLVQGETRTEEFSSTGAAGQRISLLQGNIVRASLRISDDSGATWKVVDTLGSAYGSNAASVLAVPRPGNSYDLVFGDGVLGQIPSGTITVTYQLTRGAQVSVPSGGISTTVPAFQGTSPVSVSVSNPLTKAAGGSDGESLSLLRRNLIAYGRSIGRAVSTQDFVDVLTTGYVTSPGAAGVIVAAAVDQASMSRALGTNEIFLPIWSVGGWKPSNSNAAAVFPYQRVESPGIVLIASAQAFIESKCGVTDRPVVLKGEVDRAIIEVDVQVDASVDVSAAELLAEKKISDLFLSEAILSRRPLFQTEVDAAVRSIPGCVSATVRGMYLDYTDPNLPSTVLDDTPVNLRRVYDLAPRTSSSIVSPGDIVVNVWNNLVGVGVVVRGQYYQATPNNTDLAKDAVRQAIHEYFSSKRPGEQVSADELSLILSGLSTFDVSELSPVVKSYSSNTPLVSSVEDPVVITFSGGGGIGAAASATVVGGSIVGLTLTYGGQQYLTAPTVTITGGGTYASGATAVAQINPSGAVVGLTLVSGGSGFSLLRTFDGLSEGDRILLTGQTDPAQNGVYRVGYDANSYTCTLVRTVDCDNPLKLHPGVYVRNTTTGAYFRYSGSLLNSSNFATAPKPWTTGGYDSASTEILAVRNAVILFARDAKYPSQTIRSAIPGTVYRATSIDLL